MTETPNFPLRLMRTGNNNNEQVIIPSIFSPPHYVMNILCHKYLFPSLAALAAYSVLLSFWNRKHNFLSHQHFLLQLLLWSLFESCWATVRARANSMSLLFHTHTQTWMNRVSDCDNKQMITKPMRVEESDRTVCVYVLITIASQLPYSGPTVLD